MILTTHALTGAVIGKNLNNPWLIIILSITIHFIMDHFRHGEYVEVFSKDTSIKNSGWKVVTDLIVGFLIISFFIYFNDLNRNQIINVFIGVIASIFPDFITFVYWATRAKFLEKYYSFHGWFHKYPCHSPQREWTLQNARNDILISIIAIIILFAS